MEIKGRHKIEISQHYLECTDGSSNKFYRTLVIANMSTNLATLICTYGPIGRAGQNKISHGLSPDAARREAQKKADEKKRKGYVPSSPRDVLIGMPGHTVAHTFGDDSLKDKEINNIIGNEVGRHLFEEIKEKNGWCVTAETEEEAKARELREAEALAKVKAAEEARLQAELSARSATYSSSWGEWA